MTSTEINIAIAEACGWEYKSLQPTRRGTKLPWMASDWRHEVHQKHWKRRSYPRDYSSDLNAIAEARRQLIVGTSLRVKFLNTLRAIVSRRPDIPLNKVGTALVSDYDMVDATALEQAEAILKTLGKRLEKGEG